MSMAPADTESWVVDPAFRFSSSGRLSAQGGIEELDSWRYLTSQICRDPLDLEAHVRRVLLSGRSSESGKAFSALVDLFLALGPAGKGLRAAMLNAVGAALSSDERGYFQTHLEQGLARGAALPVGTAAALDQGLIGSPSMVARALHQAAEETAIQRASALLDQGDVAAARELLEDTLMQSPDAQDVATELLLIYRHSRDDEAVRAMKQKLTSKFGRLPAAWV
jgi:hypothetical protein